MKLHVNILETGNKGCKQTRKSDWFLASMFVFVEELELELTLHAKVKRILLTVQKKLLLIRIKETQLQNAYNP